MPIKGGGGGSGASDVRGGGAYFELWAKDKLGPVLDKLEKKAKAFGGFMQGISKRAAIAGGALAAPVAALFTGGLIRAADTARLAAEFEVPIDMMSRLQYAAEAAGVSVQDVMSDTNGKYGDLIDRAPGLDPERAKQAVATQLALKDATLALQDALLTLLDIVLPLVKVMSAFIQRNAAAVKIVAAIAAGLLALSAVVAGVSFAVSGIVLLFKALVIGVGLLISPLGLAAAAVAGLVYLFVTQTETGKKMADDLIAAFRSIGEIFGETWNGVADAVKAGDLELAFKIVGVGIKAVWAQVMLSLRKGWNDFMVWTVDALRRNPWILPLIGGVVGGLVGGPGGALAGAAAGAAGALGIEFFADEIKDALKADTAGAEANLAAMRAELAVLGGRAAAAAAAAGAAEDPADRYQRGMKSFDAIKGNFNVRAAGQQFGYGDTAAVQTELQKRMAKALDEMPGKIGAAVVGGIAAK